MRHVWIVLGGCGVVVLLCAVALLGGLIGEGRTLVPPDATDVRIDPLSLSRLHITFHIPPHQTPIDLHRYLADQGWRRDTSAERTLRLDGTEPDRAVFIRRSWLGLVPEVVTVGVVWEDGWMAQAHFYRCFSIAPWTRCL